MVDLDKNIDISEVSEREGYCVVVVLTCRCVGDCWKQSGIEKRQLRSSQDIAQQSMHVWLY